MATILFQGAFPGLVGSLQSMGFFLYLFPFLLSLAILYGVLSWALEEQLPKSARGLISIILSFFVMLWAGTNAGIVNLLANLSGAGLAVASAILFIVVLLGLMGHKISDVTHGDRSKWIFIIVIILIVILIAFGAGAGTFIPIPSWVSSTDFMTVVFFVFILAIAMWWLGTETEGGKKPAAGGNNE